MPLFFSISGYVYSLVYFDEERCLKKQKIKTHLIDYAWIYIVFCVLMWGFKLLAADGVNQQISANAILLIWMRPINIYWYLYVLIAFYLLFIPLLQKTFDARVVFSILALVCISSVLVNGQVGFQIHHIMYFAIFFWIGACKQRNDNFILMKKWGATVAFIVAVVLMIVYWNGGTDYNQLSIANAFIALGLTCGFWNVFENIIGGGGTIIPLRKILPRNLFDACFCRLWYTNLWLWDKGDGGYAYPLCRHQCLAKCVPSCCLRNHLEEDRAL